jgi:GTP cyclohydrolase II
VLIDLKNWEDSWRLKRNKKLLQGKINDFLDNNKDINFENLKISFDWQDRKYTTYATILFIIKE